MRIPRVCSSRTQKHKTKQAWKIDLTKPFPNYYGWMAYAYEDLDNIQFERLVVQCAYKLFGSGVQGFAAGPDGGRDARFHGTAELARAHRATRQEGTIPRTELTALQQLKLRQ